MVGVRWQEGRGGGSDTDEEGEEDRDLLGETTALDWELVGGLPAFVRAAGVMPLHNADAAVLKKPAPFKAGTVHKRDPVLPADAFELFQLLANSLPADAQAAFHAFAARSDRVPVPLVEQSRLITRHMTRVANITSGAVPSTPFCHGDLTRLGLIGGRLGATHHWPVGDHVAAAEPGGDRQPGKPPFAYPVFPTHSEDDSVPQKVCYTFSQVQKLSNLFPATAVVPHTDLFPVVHSARPDINGARGGVRGLPKEVATTVVAASIENMLALGPDILFVFSYTCRSFVVDALGRHPECLSSAEQLGQSTDGHAPTGYPPKPGPSEREMLHQAEVRFGGMLFPFCFLVDANGVGKALFIFNYHLCMSKWNRWYAQRAATAAAMMQIMLGNRPPEGWMNYVANNALTGGLSMEAAFADPSVRFKVEGLTPEYREAFVRMAANGFNPVEALFRVKASEAGRSTASVGGSSSWRYPGSVAAGRRQDVRKGRCEEGRDGVEGHSCRQGGRRSGAPATPLSDRAAQGPARTAQ